MNKIKDLLYNTSDILVAVLILCCAVIVITIRVDAIMTYPEKMASEQSERGGYIRGDWPDRDATPDENDEDDYPYDYTEPEGNDPDADTSGDPGIGTDGGNTGDGPVSYSLYIAYMQSMNEIADNLVSLGFFENRQDVFNTLESHNAAQKVQAGNFIIPADATKDDVVRIITGSSN